MRNFLLDHLAFTLPDIDRADSKVGKAVEVACCSEHVEFAAGAAVPFPALHSECWRCSEKVVLVCACAWGLHVYNRVVEEGGEMYVGELYFMAKQME